MKKTSLALTLFCMLALTLSADEKPAKTYNGPKEKLHVYLLIGQSNMAGRAAFTTEEAKPIDRCFLLTKANAWEPAMNPLNIHSTIRKGAGMQKMNPGYMFAKTMLKSEKGISLGLVVNAKGGTKIEQWAKGTRFYKEAVKRATEAQKTGTLKGILWHQGESNAGNPDGYLDKLKALVENLRKDLKTPNLPVVAGQINKVKPINDQIAKLPATVPNTGFVPFEGLSCGDRWHFDSKSMRLLGTRYAEQMLKLLKKLKK